MKTNKEVVKTFYDEGELIAVLVRDNRVRRLVMYKVELMDMDEITDLFEGKIKKDDDRANRNKNKESNLVPN